MDASEIAPPTKKARTIAPPPWLKMKFTTEEKGQGAGSSTTTRLEKRSSTSSSLMSNNQQRVPSGVGINPQTGEDNTTEIALKVAPVRIPAQCVTPNFNEKSPNFQKMLSFFRNKHDQTNDDQGLNQIEGEGQTLNKNSTTRQPLADVRRMVVIDCETSGFVNAKLLEIAAIELFPIASSCNNGGTGETVQNPGEPTGLEFHSFIRPEEGCYIDEHASAVHGLTLDKLRDSPRIDVILPGLLKFLFPNFFTSTLSSTTKSSSSPSSSTTAFIGHNLPFDLKVIQAEAQRFVDRKRLQLQEEGYFSTPNDEATASSSSIMSEQAQQILTEFAGFESCVAELDALCFEQAAQNRSFCTMAAFRHLYPNQPRNLIQVCQFYGIKDFTGKDAHSALNDAKATVKVFKNIMAILADLI